MGSFQCPSHSPKSRSTIQLERDEMRMKRKLMLELKPILMLMLMLVLLILKHSSMGGWLELDLVSGSQQSEMTATMREKVKGAVS